MAVTVKYNVVVNNDIKISVPILHDEHEHLTTERVTKIYQTYRPHQESIKNFYILNIEGNIMLGKKENCTQCICVNNRAGFNIKYVHGVPREWSLFVSTECGELTHLDEETFTAEKLLNFIKTAAMFPEWDETLIQQWAKHIKPLTIKNN